MMLEQHGRPGASRPLGLPLSSAGRRRPAAPTAGAAAAAGSARPGPRPPPGAQGEAGQSRPGPARARRGAEAEASLLGWGQLWPPGGGSLSDRPHPSLPPTRPLSERGLLGTVGMAGVLGPSGRGRKIRAELQRGRG